MVKKYKPEPDTGSEHKKLLDAVKGREKVIKEKWLDGVKDTYDIYEGGKADETPFNILFSNTEILVPNLFSAAPKTLIRRRFGETRANEVSIAAERMADYCMDTNLAGYPSFTEAIEAAVLDAALPGQGQTRVRVVEGKACIDYVQHDDFIWAYAQRWEDTPWIAYKHNKTFEDTITEFDIDSETAAQIVKPETDSTPSNTDKGPETLTIYELYNKKDKTVYFLCDAFPDSCIKTIPDPLGLPGFFPSGKPLRLLSTPVSTMPRSLYGLYKRQAEELNAITSRIKRLTQAIRVRGVYDGNVPEIEKLFASGDTENALIPMTNPGGLNRDGGLDKHIWLMPIEKLVVVLDNLFKIREQIKSTIYEILGIGDILRGVSSASETLGAQEIKDKWGSLRIKRSRERVSLFVRDQIRLLIAAAATHTPEQDWAQITGLPYISGVQAAAMPPGPVPPGAPPPPPSWPNVLAELGDNLTRSYKIDIETNSTVDAEATQDKQDVTDFLTALGQAQSFMEVLAGAGPTGFAAAKVLLLNVSKKFRFGQEMQQAFEAMQPPPPGGSPEEQKRGEELKKREEAATQNEKSIAAQLQTMKEQFAQFKDQALQERESLMNEKTSLSQKDLQITAHENDLKVREQALLLGEKAATVEHKVREVGLKEHSVQLSEKAVSIKDQGVGLKEQAHGVKEQAHAHKESVSQTTNDHAKKDLELAKREAEHGLNEKDAANKAGETKNTQDAAANKNVSEGAANKNKADAAQNKLGADTVKSGQNVEAETKGALDSIVTAMKEQAKVMQEIGKQITQPVTIKKNPDGSFERKPSGTK